MSNVFTAVFVRLRNTYVQSGSSIKPMKHLNFDASFDLLVSKYWIFFLCSLWICRTLTQFGVVKGTSVSAILLPDWEDTTISKLFNHLKHQELLSIVNLKERNIVMQVYVLPQMTVSWVVCATNVAHWAKYMSFHRNWMMMMFFNHHLSQLKATQEHLRNIRLIQVSTCELSFLFNTDFAAIDKMENIPPNCRQLQSKQIPGK